MYILDLISEDEYINNNLIEEIVDYLLKHKVISKDQCDVIVESKIKKTRNKKLLEIIYSNLNDENYSEINIIGLFSNALRSAGCHSLANKMDIDDPVISPLSRRKGQVSLIIQVSALQIKIKELIDKQSDTVIRENIKSVWVNGVDQINSGDVPKKKASMSLMFLCCGVRKKKKQKKFKNINNNDPLDLEYEECKQKKCQLNNEIVGMRQMKIDILTEKSMKFYNTLSTKNENGGNSTEWENLVKYLEQKRKVLVFDQMIDDTSLTIVLICTTNNSLIELKNLSSEGTLEKEITHLILTPSLLDSLGVKNLRLSISLNAEDLQIASAELEGPSRRSMVFV